MQESTIDMGSGSKLQPFQGYISHNADIHDLENMLERRSSMTPDNKKINTEKKKPRVSAEEEFKRPRMVR